MLKKWRIVVNRISKVRQTTCNWIKILDKATRIVNVLHDFMLRYEAWVNAIRASSFTENFPQIRAKSIAFQQNLLRKLSQNRPFFTNRFSAKLASKLPAKSAVFPWIYLWKSREIWLFFPQPTGSPDCTYIHTCTFVHCHVMWRWIISFFSPDFFLLTCYSRKHNYTTWYIFLHNFILMVGLTCKK